MPAARVEAGDVMTAVVQVPVVEAVRTTGRNFADEAVWVVRRCAFCKRRHSHVADVTATTMILPARCNPARFYRVTEAVAQ